MPFISKDWRSTGEHWVKIGPGWERAKVLNYLSEFHKEDEHEHLQPVYNVTTRPTREIRRENSLSEALLQLDFYSACHDVRRFNYTCHMIYILLFRLNGLPGSVQRIIIRLLQEMMATAKENGWKGEMSDVLQVIQDVVVNQPVWGGQLGSAKLWQEHKTHIEQILTSAAAEKFDCTKGPPLLDFPEEVLRQILLKLNSDKDVDNLAQTSQLLGQIAEENRIWRQLATYHFTPDQISQLSRLQEQYAAYRNFRQLRWPPSSTASQNEDGNNNRNQSTNIDNFSRPEELSCPKWKANYAMLKRKFGLTREEYAEELTLCKTCGVLFWPTDSPPHDCGMAILIRVKPRDFIKYFAV